MLSAAAVLVLAILVAACSSAPTEVTVGQNDEPTETDFGEAVAADPAVASDSPPIELVSDDLPGALSLVECAWVAPHRYRVLVDWMPDEGAEPVEVDLDPLFLQSDMGFRGDSKPTKLDDAGRVSFIVDVQSPHRGELVSAARWIYDNELDIDCVVRGETVAVTRRPSAPSGDPMSNELGEFIDSLPLAEDDSLVALAYFREAGGLDQIDEFGLLEGRILRAVSFEREGTCTTMATAYTQPELRVEQSYGCPDVQGERSPGGNWVVTGATSDDLRWFEVPDGRVPQPEELDFDPDRWFDNYFVDQPRQTELGRFDWEGLRVAVWTYGTDTPDGRSHIEASFAPELGQRFGSTGGFSGSGCNEFQILEAAFGSPTEAGFLFFLTPEPDMQLFTYEGPDGLVDPPERIDIELVPASLDGYYMAVLDLRDGSYEWNTWIRPARADGTLIECTQ